ncbi:MAG TPA: hypothetical protein VGT02_03785 [Methylomirabilota bacterium]|nr:hypothetical protein [Methylomirabilota bacterium]
MDIIGGLLAGAVIAIAIVVFVRRRRQGHERYCRARGFTFDADARPAEGIWDALALIHRDGGAHSSIEGRWNGLPFTALAYQYGSSKTMTTVGVMLWKLSADQRLPQFRLTPEHLGDRIAQRLGAQDLDFAQDPEFSKAYQLQGPDEGALRQLFTPETRRFLVADPGQSIASDGRHLVWWARPSALGLGGLPSPEHLDRFFERGDTARRHLTR